jgi:hypothetical protein
MLFQIMRSTANSRAMLLVLRNETINIKRSEKLVVISS